MTSQKANPRRATRRFLAAVDQRAREAWFAHDDRCGAVTGGGCNCLEWERFDWDRSVDDDDLCDCSEGLCAGFDGCRNDLDDDTEYRADVDDYDRCYDCHGTGKCWACDGCNPGDDLGSGCSECDGWGNCWCGS